MARSTSIYIGEKLDTQVRKLSKKYGCGQGEYMRACLAYCVYFLDDFDENKVNQMISFLKTDCNEAFKQFVKASLKESGKKKSKPPKDDEKNKLEEEPEEQPEPEPEPPSEPSQPVEPVESVESVEPIDEPIPTSDNPTPTPITSVSKPIPLEDISPKQLMEELDLSNPLFEKFETGVEKAEDAEIRRYIDRLDAEMKGEPQPSLPSLSAPSTPSTPSTPSAPSAPEKPRRKITYSGTAM